MNNFLLGVLFTTLLLPVLDGIQSLLSSLFAYVITKIQIKTYNLKQEVGIGEFQQDTFGPIGFQLHPAIGQQVDIQDQDYQDYEEEE